MASEAIRSQGPTEEILRARLIAEAAKIKEMGYEVEAQVTSPEDIDTVVSKVKDKLQSREWDGYVIGFGIRGVPEYTNIFEELVNAGRELAPQARMGFNTVPNDVHVAISRMFEKK
jgi:hypothetical protein